MYEKYEFTHIEKKWQKTWKDEAAFKTPQPTANKKYVLEMFPYPSGDLHMGHVRAYTIGDLLARYYRALGHEVLHPMGWDALGLPAENAAIKDGVSPAVRTPENITRVKAQMERLGYSYDWARELGTYQPEYYRWNQWFFLQFLKHDLVYRRESFVNFCITCDTVLANEQVNNERCWRCDNIVEQRRIPEWAFRITKYADALLDGLPELTEWPERITSMQRHWIGKSHGLKIGFAVEGRQEKIDIFTTRGDTIFGVSFLSLAAEHALAVDLATPAQRPFVTAFIEKTKRQDKVARTAEGGDKEGVFTGSYAIHPLTQKKVPIWLANFVLADYGTGAVMAVPAHDQRDYEFAKKYDLPIIAVIDTGKDPLALGKATVEDGVLTGSGEFDGLSSADAREKIAKSADAKGLGQATVNWHLRDWGFSRQRYWGTPIPIVYCDEHGAVPVKEADLPVRLPEFSQVSLTGKGKAPLSQVESFVNTTCPICAKPARREVETMDTFVDSAWYYARFLSPKDDTQPFSPEAAKAWLPADIYIGGPEHAVAHLLYFRFWHKVMRELGLVSSQEPVKRLITQGMVLGQSHRCPDHGYLKSGEYTVSSPIAASCNRCSKPLTQVTEKMSKSKYNGVDPTELCENYGADTARMYVLFAAPPEKDLEYNDNGVEGISRFLKRLYQLYFKNADSVKAVTPASSMDGLNVPSAALRKALHKTIKRVTEDIGQRLHLNVPIAAFMELTNEAYKLGLTEASHEISPAVIKEFLVYFAQIIAPYAPHFADEAWQAVGQKGLVHETRWPTFDAVAVVDDEVTVAVQVNGKLRAELLVPKDAEEALVLAKAKADAKVIAQLEGKALKRVIYVKNRLLNLVVG